MSKLTTCLFLFTLATLAVSVPAQQAAVHTAGTETRVVRVQPAMRHVGARLVVTRPATPAVREASAGARARQQEQRRARVHFRH